MADRTAQLGHGEIGPLNGPLNRQGVSAEQRFASGQSGRIDVVKERINCVLEPGMSVVQPGDWPRPPFVCCHRYDGNIGNLFEIAPNAGATFPK